jgi:uncharacterized protein YqeY
MSLKEQLDADLRDAMRQGEQTRRDTIRLALSALRNAQIAAGRELTDDDTLAVLAKEAKQRRESIEEFRKADRVDLAEKEEAELAVLSAYLPQAVARDEIVEAARRAVQETGASGPKDIGKVMPVLMQQFRGRAEGKEINEVVREILAGS